MTAFFGILLVSRPRPSRPRRRRPDATTVQATRTAAAPVLDGRDDDVIWRDRPAIDQFLEARPTEGAQPRLRTEARVGYDEHNLYVFVRSFDPHPDSIVGLLARRDEQTASDYVTLMLDPYHDRRTGYEFPVNPPGSRRTSRSQRWRRGRRVGRGLGCRDPDRLARLDGRVPDPALAAALLLQGRRDLRRAVLAGRSSATPRPSPGRSTATSRSGLPSQFGTLTGLEGLGSAGRAELTPYVVTKNVTGRRLDRLRAGAQDVSASAATSDTGSRPTCCSTPRSTRTSARWRRIRPSSTSARSRPSSTSGGRSSWKGRGCSRSR